MIDPKTLRKKRTTWDFSEFEHRTEIFKSEDGNEIRVDHLQKGNSSCGYVKLVNDSKGLAVFGDFGNWIFCRPFHPSADGYVSDGYWNGKLKISSCQNQWEYDEDATRESIKKLIKDIESDPDHEQEHILWLNDLLDHTEYETEYLYYAFYHWDVQDDLDSECIPHEKKGSYQLQIVYDAFEVMCDRIYKKEND